MSGRSAAAAGGGSSSGPAWTSSANGLGPSGRPHTVVAGPDELRSYERALLDAIAPVDGVPVTVSQISRPVEDAIGQVQTLLYQDAVDKGWFAANKIKAGDLVTGLPKPK